MNESARSSGRSIVRIVVTTLLAGIVLWGIGAGITTESGKSSDRVRDLTIRLRCPVCQGESVAESPSENAQEITTLVREQVDAGWSDEQVEEFFVERYGAWILLDPPRSGSTLWLWVAPVVAATVGVIAVIGRLGRTRARRFLVVGAGALGTASIALLVVLGAAERDTRAGDAPADTAPATGRDLGAVTEEEMEAVIADNPAVIGMRLALVERYLREGDVESALRHTSIAIDLPATDQEYERALRLHGWVIALQGAPASGAEYLRAALTLSPEDRDARWFLANVEWTGLGNAQAAIDLLHDLLATEPGPEQQQRIEALLVEIESARDE